MLFVLCKKPYAYILTYVIKYDNICHIVKGEIKMKIGDRIKELREQHGMTQAELAKIVNTTKQNIYKYENGIITNIPADKIQIMANYFNVSPAYIMGWNEEIKKELKPNSIFGKKLKQAREAKKMTMDEVVAVCKRQFPECGLNKGTLSKYENGKQEPMISNVKYLAEVLDVSPDYLLGKEEKNIKHIKTVTDEDIKFALFGEHENITDEMFEKVKAFAKFVKAEKEKENGNDK